jgi:putative membrane protein
MKLFIKLIINAVALAIVAYIIPGFYFVNFTALLVASIIMGVVNTFIKPVLQVLFLPLTIITFGVTAFLINVVLIWGVSYIVPGFEIDGFFTALIASLALMLVSLFLNKLSEERSSGN